MSTVYTKPSSDDLFGAVSFGGHKTSKGNAKAPARPGYGGYHNQQPGGSQGHSGVCPPTNACSTQPAAGAGGCH